MEDLAYRDRGLDGLNETRQLGSNASRLLGCIRPSVSFTEIIAS